MTPRTTPSDNDLVRRLRDGEGDAGASLRARHWASVFDFALRMTASVETARTIADEVFDSVATSPPTVDDTFVAWAYAAAHRRVMALPDLLPTVLTDLTDDVEVVVDLRDEARPIDEQLTADVWDAVTRLDRQTQAVVDLHLRRGLEPSELAPILGIEQLDAAEAVQEMKRTAAEAIAVQLLRRDTEHSCADLDQASSLETARAHIASCDTCSERRATRYSPLQVLGALKVVPAVPPQPAAVGTAVAPVTLRRRLATPLGLLAMLAGAVAFVLVGMLAWNDILKPLGARVIEVVRSPDPSPTTVSPTTQLAAPVVLATADSAQTDEDTPVDIDVLANDGGAGTIVVSEDPEHGVAAVVGPVVRYVPDPNYNGPDTFAYTVVADDGTESSATVRLTIIPVDDVPEVIRFAALEGVEDEPVQVVVSDWVSDVDDDGLDVVGFDAISVSGGTVDEGLLYIPAPHYNGIDSFQVVVSDGTTEVAFPVLVSLAAVNDLPAGPVRLSVTTDEDVAIGIPALDGWSDADGDELVVLLPEETTALGGSLRFSSGEIVYEPAPDVFGSDSFAYRVSDGTDPVDVQVAVEVVAVPDAPTVTRSSFTIDENSPVGSLVGTLRATDPEGDSFSFALGQSVSLVSISPSGRVELLDSLDHESTSRLTVAAVVTDASGASRRFEVVVRVRDIDEAPTGRDQQMLVTPFAAAGTNIARVQVTDPEGGTLTFRELNGDPANAVTVSKSGIVRTAREAEPILYPLTLAVEATDPGGQSTTVLVVVRLDDFVGPEVGDVLVSEDVVWELRPNGASCPFGPSRSDVAVAVSDTSGIATATIEWSAVFDGVPLSGETRMAVSDGVATGSFTFGSGLVEPGGESLLTASILVVDRAGNRTRSEPFTITVKACSNQ